MCICEGEIKIEQEEKVLDGEKDVGEVSRICQWSVRISIHGKRSDVTSKKRGRECR